MGTSTALLHVGGPIGHADIVDLSRRVRRFLEWTEADVVICDVGAVSDPDLTAVDVLARLDLSARRLGCSLELRHVSPELQVLLALVGLDEVVGAGARR